MVGSFTLPLDLRAVLVRHSELRKTGTYEIVKVLLVEIGSLLAFTIVSGAWKIIKGCRRTRVDSQAMFEDHVHLRDISVRSINPFILHVLFTIKHIIVIFVVVGHFRCLSGRGEADVRMWRRFGSGGLHKSAISLLQQGRPGARSPSR